MINLTLFFPIACNFLAIIRAAPTWSALWSASLSADAAPIASPPSSIDGERAIYLVSKSAGGAVGQNYTWATARYATRGFVVKC